MISELAFFSSSPEQTFLLGVRLGTKIWPGCCVLLSGGLGSGKTVLASGIAHALGVKGPVTSPSYAIVHEYPTTPPFVHMDLYRIANEDEALQLGIEELLDHSVCAIEWPERARMLFPEDAVDLQFSTTDEGRNIVLRAPAAILERLGMAERGLST